MSVFTSENANDAKERRKVRERERETERKSAHEWTAQNACVRKCQRMKGRKKDR